ncbi:MAG: helix-turn-helix domain-containing protein [Pirellulaceae bacterium]|nr:helix-turn-helix domain-containing protein [Pirellulaceae bacterium]
MTRHAPPADAPTVDRELLKSTEVARMLSIGTRTLWRWSRSGKMPAPVIIADGTVRFRAADILAWVSDGCPPMTK